MSTERVPSSADRIYGAMLGLAVADALGAPLGYDRTAMERAVEEGRFTAP